MFYYRIHEVTGSGEYISNHALTASITVKHKWYRAPFCLDKCRCKGVKCYVPANVKFVVACSGKDVEAILIERVA